jgi:hypothetical protein
MGHGPSGNGSDGTNAGGAVVSEPIHGLAGLGGFSSGAGGGGGGGGGGKTKGRKHS